MKKYADNLPNALTAGNFTCGLFAILWLFSGQGPALAVGLITLGGICDFFDGYLARKLGVVSNFGKQLDSFADLITFGVAPVLLVLSTQHVHPPILKIAALIYLLAGAFRLARFNVAADGVFFVGFPITAAGLLLSYSVFFISQEGRSGVWLPVVLMVGMALLMVGRWKIIRKI